LWKWAGETSGGISVICAILGKLVGGTGLKSVAYIALLFCAGIEIAKRWNLEARLKPSIRVACSPNISCCRTFPGHREHCVYRVRIRNVGNEPITNCKARLTSIERDGELLWDSDSPQLTFTPSEGNDTLNKTIERDVDHTIDVLFLYRDYPLGVAIATRNLVWDYKALSEIFTKGAEYRLHMKISGSPMVNAKLVLLFKWNCNYSTSELWLEKAEPKETLELT
jgi:hypothetical protein